MAPSCGIKEKRFQLTHSKFHTGLLGWLVDVANLMLMRLSQWTCWGNSSLGFHNVLRQKLSFDGLLFSSKVSGQLLSDYVEPISPSKTKWRETFLLLLRLSWLSTDKQSFSWLRLGLLQTWFIFGQNRPWLGSKQSFKNFYGVKISMNLHVKSRLDYGRCRKVVRVP